MTVFLRLFLIFSLLLPAGSPALAQGVGTMYGNSGFSNATTSKLTRSLTEGIAKCRESLEAVYRYDCYRQTYADAVKDLKYSRDYAPAQAILAEVEQSLGRTIARHADPSAPVVRQGFTKFRAIRAESLPTAKAEFVVALEEAETRLLRSPDNGQEHFQRIAAAIETNKVLLRSALLLVPSDPFDWAVLMPSAQGAPEFTQTRIRT